MNRNAAHTKLVDAVLLELGREPDLVLWKNNQSAGAKIDKNGREYFGRAGLPKGSPDIVGILTWGSPPTGRWFSLEAKTGRGELSPEQLDFAELVRKRGGFCAEVRSTEDARAALARARNGADR
jgi:hypothetical protein